uniref:Uncharacterized protein n=1 Tax=Moniliophthora roreri TaxID=221103 RepID=A0A0W0EY72_MONRR
MSSRVSVFYDVACRTLNPTVNCTEAPQVEARAARIQATVTTVTSALSTALTGPLSRWGDMHGRKPLLLFTLSGGLAMEFVFILVTRQGSFFYNYAEPFIVLGSVLDGVVGGLSTFNGLVNALHPTRFQGEDIFHSVRNDVRRTRKWFLGGVILKSRPDLSPYILFFGSVTLLALLEIFILVMVPESNHNILSEQQKSPREGPNSASATSSMKDGLKHLLIGFVTPISMFIPRKIGESRRDWNLTFVGGALFLYLVSIGVYQIKYLYGTHVYSWKADQASFTWLLHVVALDITSCESPVIISYFKPKPQHGESPSIQSELRSDKLLASTSLAVDGLSDALVVLVPSSSQFAFVALSCLSSFTSGGNPTLHSLAAVCLHASGHSSEVGSLFGAMAVLSAIAHVISPTIYAVTYGSTVASFPKAIFVLAAVLLGLAVFLLSLVRSRHALPNSGLDLAG